MNLNTFFALKATENGISVWIERFDFRELQNSCIFEELMEIVNTNLFMEAIDWQV